VPSSSEKFLQNSLRSKSSTVVYDLEDSVHASAKSSARRDLAAFLGRYPQKSDEGSASGPSVAVRPNNPFTGQEQDGDSQLASSRDAGGLEDLSMIWDHKIRKAINGGTGPTILMPKVSPMKVCTMRYNSTRWILSKVESGDMLGAIDQILQTQSGSKGKLSSPQRRRLDH